MGARVKNKKGFNADNIVRIQGFLRSKFLTLKRVEHVLKKY